jgi:aspartate aminotransferase-like enzyme
MRYRLFAPGPTPVPEAVRLRMAEAVLHHRTPAFEQIFGRVRDGLKWVFQTQNEVLCLSGTGTAGMDGAVANFFKRGDKAIFVNGGKFGERWGKILEAYGCQPIEIKVEWGSAADPQQIADALKKHPDARGVLLQAAETSPGVAHPVKEIAKLTKDKDALCIVDGITAVGVWDVGLDRDGIDVLVSGSQKAFMLPPGLAFVGVSAKAWKAAERSDLPKFYLNFAAEKKAAEKNSSAYTSSVSLMCGLDTALGLLREEGLENVFRRHDRLARGTRAAMQALGCELYAKSPSNGVTAVWSPSGLDSEKLIKRLRDHYNMTIAEGQDQAKGKIFRVAHMGYFDELDMITLVGAIEGAFGDLGVKFQRGAGVAAAQNVFASQQ